MRCVIALSKNPFILPVKTRLARETSPEFAQALYLCFLEDIRDKILNLNLPFYLGYLPPSEKSLADFEKLLGKETHYFPQIGNSLGFRMLEAFQARYREGYKEVLLMGCDCPDLPPSLIQQAFQSLQTHDLAISPLQDGGYAYLAASQKGFLPEIFQLSTWDSPSIYHQTKALISKYKRKLAELLTWQDVDNLADLSDLFQRNDTGWFQSSKTFGFLQEQQANQKLKLHL